MLTKIMRAVEAHRAKHAAQAQHRRQENITRRILRQRFKARDVAPDPGLKRLTPEEASRKPYLSDHQFLMLHFPEDAEKDLRATPAAFDRSR